MLHELRRHAADDGDVVDTSRDVREEVADRRAALAVAVEVPRGRHDVAVLVEHRARRLERHRLAGFLGQARLGVERVDVREPAGHVAEDDALDLRLEMGRLLAGLLRGAGVGRICHQAGQGQHPESGRGRAQHLPARDRATRARVKPRIERHGGPTITIANGVSEVGAGAISLRRSRGPLRSPQRGVKRGLPTAEG